MPRDAKGQKTDRVAPSRLPRFMSVVEDRHDREKRDSKQVVQAHYPLFIDRGDNLLCSDRRRAKSLALMLVEDLYRFCRWL
jgi:hypothetical protein